MRRRGPKGSGRFERISWDEALERIARACARPSTSDGAEAIWPFVGTGNMGLIQGAYGAGRRLWNVLGTSRHVQTICTIAGGFGTGYTLGDNRVGMDPETLPPLEADPALGRQRAVDASAPVAAGPRGAAARRARRRHRSDPNPHRGGVR